MIIIIWWLAACALSVFFGHWLADNLLRFIRGKAGLEHHSEAIILWLGGTERAVATTLVIFAPPYLPAFVGGWIALKFAVGWKRYKEKEKVPETKAGTGAFIALIGNVISFSVAILAGLIVNPDALTIWAATSH